MSASSLVFVALLVLGAATGGEARRVRRDVSWNDMADALLSYSRDQIISQDKSRVALEDFHENFSKKKGFLRVKGEFRATGGWLESFASLHRVGDVTVARSGDVSLMTAVLGLSDLRLGYDRYEVRVWGAGPHGTIEGKIGKNAVRFVIKFDSVDGECVTTLEDLRVEEFDDFRVNVSGLGSFDFLAEKVVEWLVEKRKDDIKESIEKQLRKEMHKALKNFECDEYASLMFPI